ncbi:IS1380 family transposase [Microvirga sp. VF16]|uniref:IS1380 family transposase n=1 Tax=Microvirga sp. VF16 TaxID=2807101 RepID=UPI00193CF820|nr:IS1380 family transposase [Microvirga sp. VF16]QRM35093.1 IS1380 family transposase [Microvirga sp. VF16]QRM35151.1 IS1380 family transposase [Microvirga sp. VF16]
MTDDTTATFLFPAVGRKKITAAFDGGRLSSDGGVLLLAQAERRLGIAERLARVIPDRRDPERIKHAIPDMIRARIFAIACGYEDCNDFGPLRSDPAFKLACGRLPETGADLASQPTLSRLENTPTIRDAIRLTYALIDQWMASYATPPHGVVLDIDDTCDVVHGHQQLSLFNAHYDERCFLPIHVYDTQTGRPVAVVLRPGKTPSGREVQAYLRRLVRRIRTRWPTTQITIRGDSHYARPEVMDFCEANGLSYIFGLTGTRPLTAKVQDMADAVRTQRALEDCEVVRGFAETKHRAGSWSCERRAVARIEATRLGLDIRFVVTNLIGTSPQILYESLYCARGQAENWIKFHKTQLASDRTSCRRVVANQVRLVLHTAAYWLMLSVRDAIPTLRDLARAEFATLRLRLLKIAVRVQESASRIRLAYASCCPEADLFRRLAGALASRPRTASP